MFCPNFIAVKNLEAKQFRTRIGFLVFETESDIRVNFSDSTYLCHTAGMVSEVKKIDSEAGSESKD